MVLKVLYCPCFFSCVFTAKNRDNTALWRSGCSKCCTVPFFVFPKQNTGTVQQFGDQGAQSAVLSLFVVFPKQQNRATHFGDQGAQSAVLSLFFAFPNQKE